MRILYVISMAIAFSMEIDSISLPYFLKYIIAAVWIIIGLNYKKSNSLVITISNIEKNLIKLLMTPIIFSFCYTLVIWGVGLGDNITFSNITRLISNLGCMAIIAVSTVIVVKIFDKEAINLTFYAVILTIFINAVVVIQNYGISEMLTYITHVFQADNYLYGSDLSKISYAMEIHDGTFAMGIFLLYFLFYEQEERKKRFMHIGIALFCSYLGFKRNELIGVVVVSILAITIVRKKSREFLKTNQIMFLFTLIICFSFVLAIKYINQMTMLLSVLDIYRIKVYNFMRSIYTVSPFYLGKGYSYVNYILGNQKGLLGTSHSDLVRVYVEMGFWGFIAWIWYYFSYIPRVIYKKYSKIAGKMFMMFSFYIFSTYFLDNTLTMFANQFVYYIIPISILHNEYQMEKNI